MRSRTCRLSFSAGTTIWRATCPLRHCGCRLLWPRRLAQSVGNPLRDSEDALFEENHIGKLPAGSVLRQNCESGCGSSSRKGIRCSAGALYSDGPAFHGIGRGLEAWPNFLSRESHTVQSRQGQPNLKDFADACARFGPHTLAHRLQTMDQGVSSSFTVFKDRRPQY